MKCACLTQLGKQCSRSPKKGSSFCFQHQLCTKPVAGVQPVPTKKVQPAPAKKITPPPAKKITPPAPKKITPPAPKKITPPLPKKVQPAPPKKVKPTHLQKFQETNVKPSKHNWVLGKELGEETHRGTFGSRQDVFHFYEVKGHSDLVIKVEPIKHIGLIEDTDVLLNEKIVELQNKAAQEKIAPKIVDFWVADDNQYIVMAEKVVSPLEAEDDEDEMKMNTMLFDKIKKMHQLGIVHKDLRFNNVVLNASREPFIIDFNQAIISRKALDQLNDLGLATAKIFEFESKEHLPTGFARHIINLLRKSFKDHDFKEFSRKKVYNPEYDEFNHPTLNNIMNFDFIIGDVIREDMGSPLRQLMLNAMSS